MEKQNRQKLINTMLWWNPSGGPTSKRSLRIAYNKICPFEDGSNSIHLRWNPLIVSSETIFSASCRAYAAPNLSKITVTNKFYWNRKQERRRAEEKARIWISPKRLKTYHQNTLIKFTAYNDNKCPEKGERNKINLSDDRKSAMTIRTVRTRYWQVIHNLHMREEKTNTQKRRQFFLTPTEEHNRKNHRKSRSSTNKKRIINVKI